MPEGATLPEAEPLCASGDLVERGRAVVWDLLQWGRPMRAFALRFDGRVVAYLNQCAHVPTEMDWQEGEFLDMDRRWIVCATHGAHYEPETGDCVAGPCVGARLTMIGTVERDGQVFWLPTADLRPVPFDEVLDEPPGASDGPA